MSPPDDPAPAPASPLPWRDEAALVEALQSAGTSVWEWDIATDELRGIGRCEQMLGYPVDVNARTQADWDRFVHPDDRPAVDRAYEAHAAGRSPRYEATYRARAADGRWRWLVEVGRIVSRAPDGRPLRMVGTISDINERRLAEQHRDQLRERLEEIARSVPGMLFQMEQTPSLKRFTYASDRSLDLLGVTPGELLADLAVYESMRLLDRAAEESLRQIDPERSSGPWITEYPVQRRDGAVRWIRVTAISQHQPGHTLWHGYMEDVSERREFDAMRQRVAGATAANRAKTEFLSHMSHELRTPLNAVLGFAQLLEMDERDPLSDGQRQRVARIREAGLHLMDMIGDLLDLARIESGQLALDIAPVTLLAVVQECCEMLAPAASARPVQLELPAPDPAMTWQALADRTRLRQVLLNLLSNAVKYNRPDGRVTVTISRDGARLRTRITDTGWGIAADDLQGLFQPFNRLGHARSGIEGTGIGLAVSRGLAEMMGGTIEVDSQAGVGTSFTLVLQAAGD